MYKNMTQTSLVKFNLPLSHNWLGTVICADRPMSLTKSNREYSVGVKSDKQQTIEAGKVGGLP